jgi:uncharacterized SAM-binding protein YcdF (DUF218 family)
VDKHAKIQGMSPEPRALIHDFMFVPDLELEADLTVVLGMNLWQRPVERALELYRRGVSGKLLFSGGYNHRIGTTEAEAMAIQAQALGVARADIVLDAAATNTQENFRNCFGFIQSMQLGRPCRLNIVAISYHMRRAVTTAERTELGSVVLGRASYPSIHYLDDQWYDCPRGRQDVLSELEKMDRYFPGSVPDGVWMASRELRNA